MFDDMFDEGGVADDGELVAYPDLPASSERVFGNLDTHLEISHLEAANAAVDDFLRGWSDAKADVVPSRRAMAPMQRGDYMYGYHLGLENRLYFTQALHSFYIRLEKARRI